MHDVLEAEVLIEAENLQLSLHDGPLVYEHMAMDDGVQTFALNSTTGEDRRVLARPRAGFAIRHETR